MTNYLEPEEYVESQTIGVSGLLDALTDTVERARAMPMSSSVLVNRNEVLDLLDALREALPSQITRADEVLSDAGQVFEDAAAQAEQVLAQARAQAHEMLSQQEITVAATAHAKDIVAKAQAEAIKLTTAADDYCDRRLADFEIDLGKLITQVQAGRNKLAERLDEGVEHDQTRA
ncbi:hypothetical protein V5R04_09660 [Jonesiaceae bacterium BS-20]|uniref:Cell division initiation protein n=1 Tax=Jonesiaceae bacterium BS-20 TaxID=3120821 RepID=A0AAU7DUR3_9MICO